MNKRKIKSLTSWFVGFVASLMLFGFLSLGVMKVTLFNQGYMISAVKKSGYINSLTKEINTNISDLGLGSNIPADVLKDVVSKKTVETNINSFIRSIYTDVPFVMKGKEKIEADIQTRVDNYAKEKGYKITPEVQKNIDTLKSTSVDNTERTIQISYISVYGKKLLGFQKTLFLMLILTGMLALIFIILSVSITSHWQHRRVRMIAYIFGGSGLMLTVLPGITLLSNMIERLSISTQSIYYFLTTYIKGFALTFIYWGIILVVVGVITWVISERLRHKVV